MVLAWAVAIILEIVVLKLADWMALSVKHIWYTRNNITTH
jgi:galactitol-specific phosphotransferase system IIC component